MKKRQISILSSFMFFCIVCSAQTANDFKPAGSNQPGKQFPQVNSEGRVRAGISAPQALKVQLDIGGKKYDR